MAPTNFLSLVDHLKNRTLQYYFSSPPPKITSFFPCLLQPFVPNSAFFSYSKNRLFLSSNDDNGSWLLEGEKKRRKIGVNDGIGGGRVVWVKFLSTLNENCRSWPIAPVSGGMKGSWGSPICTIKENLAEIQPKQL